MLYNKVKSFTSCHNQTKRLFDGVENKYIIPFGSDAVNDASHGILRGRMTLSLAEMKQTFDNSINDTLSSCSKLFEGQIVKVSTPYKEATAINGRILERHNRWRIRRVPVSKRETSGEAL
jgi:hypothetical protein